MFILYLLDLNHFIKILHLKIYSGHYNCSIWTLCIQTLVYFDIFWPMCLFYLNSYIGRRLLCFFYIFRPMYLFYLNSYMVRHSSLLFFYIFWSMNLFYLNFNMVRHSLFIWKKSLMYFYCSILLHHINSCGVFFWTIYLIILFILCNLNVYWYFVVCMCFGHYY